MKRRLFCAGIMLCGAGLTWLLLYRPATLITHDRFEMLEAGMTQSEVERVLGGPARDDCGEPVIVWVPRGDTLHSMRIVPDGGTNGILFREDSPPAATADSIFVAADFPESGCELVWLSETVLIAVLFDEDGRLLEKHISDVKVLERPTALDWIRSRF